MSIAALAKNFVNLIYPLHCASCRGPLDPLDTRGVCENCMARIRRNPKPNCARCGRSIDEVGSICADCRRVKPHFDRGYSACLYDGALVEIIHRFKYNGALSLNAILVDILAEFVRANHEIADSIDILTCVPLGNNRMRQRGYNQSCILASGLSERIAIPFLHTLAKAASTRNQNELSREERMVNLDGAFKSRRTGRDIENLRILLIDDVMTTGATLSECAKTLKEAGAKEVRCLTLARGL